MKKTEPTKQLPLVNSAPNPADGTAGKAADKTASKKTTNQKAGNRETAKRIIQLSGQTTQPRAESPTESSDKKSNKKTNKKPDKKPAKKSRSLWYALYLPQFVGLPEKLQQQRLESLAHLATEVSSSVSFHDTSLVFEVRSSLRYFGGIDNLHEFLTPQIKQRLQEWGSETEFDYAASPTVTGSLLLARGGCNLLVHRRDSLRSALGKLTTDVLELNREQRRRLYTMGVRRLQDLWRLPNDGLRKRFGSDFINQLQQALGETPEPQQYYQPPPSFSVSYELSYEVENVDLLMPVLEEFLAQLVDFLRRRDLSTSRLVVSLLHEHQDSTTITLGLRQPSRCPQHLLQLLEVHCSNLVVPAPVVALKLGVERLDAYLGKSGQLLQPDQNMADGNVTTRNTNGKTDSHTRPSSPYKNERLELFMEQLQARLGEQPIRRIDSIAEHCPEYATPQLDLLQSPVRNRLQVNNPRPLWLLPEPRPLKVHRGKLYHHQPIRILSGPERIETRWWSGLDVRRDYYVALEENGRRLWIYREKSGEQSWHLHGVFA